MGEALRNDHIQAAFIIAPLSIVLHQQGAGVKLIYIGNRHESTLVYRKDLTCNSFADLAGKSYCGSTAIFRSQRVYTSVGRKIRCFRA